MLFQRVIHIEVNEILYLQAFCIKPSNSRSILHLQHISNLQRFALRADLDFHWKHLTCI